MYIREINSPDNNNNNKNKYIYRKIKMVRTFKRFNFPTSFEYLESVSTFVQDSQP